MTKSDPSYIAYLKEVCQYASQKLKLNGQPKLVLKHSAENAQDLLGYTGDYDHAKDTIHLYVTGRHIIDVARTMCHELVHRKQYQDGLLKDRSPNSANDPGYAQKDPLLRKAEAEAYLLGSVCYRDFQDSKRDQAKKSQ